MSKFFKTQIQSAFAAGFKMVGYYDTYYNEYILVVQLAGNTLVSIPFSTLLWNPFDSYELDGADISSVTNPTHATVSYDSGTGLATYTPDEGFVGNTVGTFQFEGSDGLVTKNVCLNWIAGDSEINPFYFTDLTSQPLATLIDSNTVLISGIDVPVSISITGGDYRINDGAWVSTGGTVVDGDIVQVRVLSSASVNTSTSAGLTVSTYSTTFTVTTKQYVTLRYMLTEQTSPTFVDGNIYVQDAGSTVSPFPVTSSATGSTVVLDGDTIAVTGYAILTNMGVGSQLRMVVKQDGVNIYNNTIPNNPPPDDAMIFDFVSQLGSIYDVNVDTYSNTNPPESCGIPISYTGGEAFPSITEITLGATTGDISLSFDSYSIPDKYEVWFDGVKVIDTGYRGDTSYQSGLDVALAARGLPPETIVSPGYGSESFTKSTATTTALVYVYAPMEGTAWTFQLQCPVTVDPFTFIDLTNQPISTLIESNSITVSGNATPATISVVGGEYSVNGGIWTIVPGAVNAGDTVKVRQTSSASYSTTTDTTLTIAGTSDTFSITTGSLTTGYVEVIVDSSVPAGEIISITGTGLPSGLNPVNQFSGPPSSFGFIGTIPSQVLTIQIDNPTADPATNISIYYQSDGSTENNPVTVSGTYPINLTKNIVAPDFIRISLILVP